MSGSEQQPAVLRPWRGLGSWNLFFIFEFALAAFGYLDLNILCNALLIAALLCPLRGVLHVLRDLAAFAAAAALLYSESWLPGIDSLLANRQAVAGFSTRYMMELAWDFLNFRMIGWGALAAAVYFLVRSYVRVSFFTIAWFVVTAVTPWWEAMQAPAATEAAPADTQTAASGSAPRGAADAKTVDEWYAAFLSYEKERRAELPHGLSEKDTPFDILLLSICSLSNDDLAASQLDAHPVFSRFNIRFDRFNSATGYSGPAVLRLLNGACGQPSHNDLYGERRTECELLTRLGTLGYKERVLMDHPGEYDSFLQSLRDKAGLTAPLESASRSFPVRYMGFDDEPISDDLSVLRWWQRTQVRSKDPRTVTLMNFISLHDGNRLPRHGRSEPFKPRAKQLLDDLERFMTELERSGRRVMLIVVPEHGAAVRGDRIQAPRLRDIPSLRITEVPVLVKFFGLKGLPAEPIHVSGSTSYLALTTLIGKTLGVNYYGRKGGAVPLEELVKDLPQTNPVSENGQAQVLEYKGREYFRQKGGDWKLYQH
ncbi:MAG: cellulose biosynthesis protein BcsG [Sutterella sp.]|nr:cellulose biosynthesis protein BcsG [Sutterella sp.]